MALDRGKFSKFSPFGLLAIGCFCFLLVPSHRVFAQVDEGSITGTIQDNSGALVPNAQVTLLNTDQGTVLQTKSGGSGDYTFAPVRAGHYTLTVTAQGFSKTHHRTWCERLAEPAGQRSAETGLSNRDRSGNDSTAANAD